MLAFRSLVWRLLRLAGPVALARLGIMGMGVVDVMVVGQYRPQELPHQALAWAPIGVLLVTGIGLLTGVQVLAAREFGAGRRRAAGAAWRRGLVVATLAGLGAIALVWGLGPQLYTVFGIDAALAVPAARVARILALSMPLHFHYIATALFLESIQRPLPSVVVMWSANVVNLLLNLVLVPEFGADGSAWATGGARVVLALGVVVWLLRVADAFELGVRGPVSGTSYRELLGVGAAAALSHAAEAGAFSGMTMIAGRLGAGEVAAYQILLNVLALMFMAALGISAATAVLTSDAVGRRDAEAATRASFVGLAVSFVFATAAALAILALAEQLGRAYTADAILAAQIAGLLWLVALIMAPDAGQAVAAAALRARGDNWFPTASHLVAYALVMPLLGFTLAEKRAQGVSGLMLAILTASVLSCAVLSARLWMLRRRLPKVSR
ncbi:MAG TPA: MATE family efflux transporter [Polyangiaceae bacterium]|nr:MATE family efflux transporter [Polyangiaceae bacterium]